MYMISRLILLAIAGVCVLAVFAVYRIERAGSPVGAPTLTRVFSPDNNGIADAAVLTFRVPRPLHVDVWVSRTGTTSRIATLATRRRVNGTVRLAWNGRMSNGSRVRSGSYRVFIRVRDLNRTFPVTRPTTVDLTSPTVDNLTMKPGPGADFATLSWTSDIDTAGRRVELDGRRLRIRKVSRSRHGNQYRFTLLLELGNVYRYSDLAASGVLIVRDAAGNTTSMQVTP